MFLLKSSLYCLKRGIHWLLESSYYICALLPVRQRYLLPLNIIYRAIWIMWAFYISSKVMYHRIRSGDGSISSLVGTTLFLSNCWADILAICETSFRQSQHRHIHTSLRDIDDLLQRHLHLPMQRKLRDSSVLLQLWLLLFIQFACDGARLAVSLRSVISPVFFVSLPILVGIRMRYIQIIAYILQANQRVEYLREALFNLAEFNRAKSIYSLDVWRPYATWEYEQVNAARLIYARIFKVYQTINACCGWSILAIFITSFMEFVCNAFWCYEAYRTSGNMDLFIYNGSTSLALSSLVTAMFWITDITKKNSYPTMAIIIQQILQLLKEQQNNNHSVWQFRLIRFTIFCLNAGLVFFALTPSINQCWPRLATLLFYAWLCEIVFQCVFGFYLLYSYGAYTLANLMTVLLYFSKIVTYCIVLWDTYKIRGQHENIIRRYARIVWHFRVGLNRPIDMWSVCWQLACHVLLMLLLLTCCHLFVIWSCIYTVGRIGTMLHLVALPSTIALQFKLLEFLVIIGIYNGYGRLMRRHLNALGERNLRRVFASDGIQQHKFKFRNFVRHKVGVALQKSTQHEPQELSQLMTLKTLYTELFIIFKLFNQFHGLSLLAFTTLYFTNLLCNTYWVFLSVIARTGSNYSLIQCGFFLLIVILQLILLCWHCQDSYDHSRSMGCLIYKLVKPLGNKRYNDLVSEFSLQILHQRFIITAMEFFNLDLNLLGKMAAAIVTYLVILIQFLYTEKSKTETASRHEMISNLTKSILKN